ncbi:aminotransferase class I/II-fold pyridoxal phosphate-dependent enzyme [Bartonella sp. DGB2]|uniref:aminotransferase class I/II-fold pyridoxal phosphate-dependent enzyme n=1 Tax=Bartonella sp. DGB2 TaxID=3388426 RepID=UPI00398FA793
MKPFYSAYQQVLERLKAGDRYRFLRTVEARSVATLSTTEASGSVLDFSSNDYLGLSRDSRILSAAFAEAKAFGHGATGARLLSGDFPFYHDFERQIAQDKRTQTALLMTSGFQANVSALATLLDEGILGVKPLVYFDRLNHASLYQAVFLSGAQLCRYHHNDMMHLRTLLQRDVHQARPRFIVSETVFGMDGDCAPLADLIELARQYSAFLYLDEAHATGVYGMRGYGLSPDHFLEEVPYLVMGTFSKALGGFGAYIATDEVVRALLINKAPGFIYSTALSPMLVGAARAAWSLVPHMHEERAALQRLGAILRTHLDDLGLNFGHSTTHIVPIILGSEAVCLQIQKALLASNIIVSVIRPPTVPPGTARLRIALNKTHNADSLYRFAAQLAKIL